MIPKYPFRVEVTRRLGAHTNQVTRMQKSFETILAASDYASRAFREPAVKRVQTFVVIDDRSRSENGGDVTFTTEESREAVR